MLFGVGSSVGDDLLDRHDRAGGGEHGLLLHAHQPPDLDVALAVGALGVDDRHVGVERRDGGETLTRERTLDLPDRVRVLGEVGADVAAEDTERQACRAGRVAGGHPGVAVLLDLQRLRPAVLDRVAEALQRPDPRVAAPREGQAVDAAGADQLVVDDVGRHAHEVQVTPALADDLVPGGVRDQVRETLHRHGVAVAHEARHRLVERQQFGHAVMLAQRVTRPRCRTPCRSCR